MTIPVRTCVACGAPLPVEANFCPGCGTAVDGSRRSAPRVSSWLAAAGAAVVVVLALGVVVWRGRALPPQLVAASNGPAPVPPDISSLSPKERFDRLYGRVMQALQSGDAATMSRFAPMALAAYDMIDSADVDSVTRRRATVLRLHLGDTTAARALGGSRAAPLPGTGSTSRP